jgi:hypothetical protein
MSGQFRVTVWDPALIVSQIVAVQSFFYVTFGVLLIAGALLTGIDLTLYHVFSYKVFHI